MERNDVYKAIDSERDYQEAKWGGKSNDEGKTVESFMVYMMHYLNLSYAAVSTMSGHDEALEQLRKVVGIGVACFERHGVPFRQPSDVSSQEDKSPQNGSEFVVYARFIGANGSCGYTHGVEYLIDVTTGYHGRLALGPMRDLEQTQIGICLHGEIKNLCLYNSYKAFTENWDNPVIVRIKK